MANIISPHDKFFKESFSRLEVVQSLIEEVFPLELKERINLQKLQLSNASYVDEELAEHFADLVYQTTFADDDVLVTLLFEHKSFTDFPQWQLLRYMTNVEREEQKQDKKPSVVIPIIIYHGKTPWKKRSLKSYYGSPHKDLHKFIPEFDYLLFSLNSWEDHQIANFKNVFLSTAAMLLKHSRDEKETFLRLETFWIEKLKALDDAHEDDYIRTVFLYMENSLNLTTKELIIIFTKVSKQVTNIAMTAAEHSRLEERQITMEYATFNYVKGLLRKGFQADFIADTFSLPIQKVEEIIQKIKASDN